MGQQKLPIQQKEKFHRTNFAIKAAEAEKRNERIHQNEPPFSFAVRTPPPNIPPDPQNILSLQKTIGNQAVGRLIQAKSFFDQTTPLVQRQTEEEEETIQGKLVPEQITSMVQRQEEPVEEDEMLLAKFLDGQIMPLVQTQEEPEEKEKTIQKRETSSQVPISTAKLDSQFKSLKRGGQPLSKSLRAYFEPRFGYDFSDIRVHTGRQAALSARTINAQAYTVGRDVVFGEGRYSPETKTGRKLLAHELTHVLQQRSFRPEVSVSMMSEQAKTNQLRLQRQPKIREGIVLRVPAESETEADLGVSDRAAAFEGKKASPNKSKQSIQESVRKVLGYIKAEAEKRSKKPPSINPSSNFYKVLKSVYLKEYLGKPSKKKGKVAVSKIGRTMEVRRNKSNPKVIEVRPEGGKWRRAKNPWEKSAWKFWSNVTIPSVPKELQGLPIFQNLQALPPKYHGATDILIKEKTDILPFIDVAFLLGVPKNAMESIEADFRKGGKNISQLLHWATGVKLADEPREAMRELFLLYEELYLEGWDVFGQDALNDLIAEEQGRLLGVELQKGPEGAIKTEKDLLPFLNASFLQARAWVGALLRIRKRELEAYILLQKPLGTRKYRQKGKKRIPVWPNTTIFQMLAEGRDIETVKKVLLVQSYVEIYTLIFEAEQWEKKQGKIELSPLQKKLAEGSLSKTMDLVAKQIRNEKITFQEKLGVMSEIAELNQ